MMIRYPIVSGQFYSDNFAALSKEIEQCFNKGPGSMPGKRKNRQVHGIIAPHAGYSYSGSTAAWSYKEIAESEFPDVFVILGLSHSGHRTCVSLYDWETPFGIVQNDIEFSKALKITDDEKAHAGEHSIEVQLPFLQFANRDRLKEIRICPIIVTNPAGVAEKIRKTAQSQEKKIIVVASSDFTHYGPNYGFLPFVSNVKENLHNLDQVAVRKILRLDIEGFIDYIAKTGATICGQNPIIALMEYMRLVGMKNSKLLHYTTSGDILKDFTNAVGYASMSFY